MVFEIVDPSLKVEWRAKGAVVAGSADQALASQLQHTLVYLHSRHPNPNQNHPPVHHLPTKTDGDRIARGVEFGVLRGSARSILVAERIALNFMQRMSGIATATAAMVDAVKGTDTR
jgi:hypothetical protein